MQILLSNSCDGVILSNVTRLQCKACDFSNIVLQQNCFHINSAMFLKAAFSTWISNWLIFRTAITGAFRILSNIYNPFVPNATFFYPLKISENYKVFCCFQGVEKGSIGNKWDNGPFCKNSDF